MWFCLEACLDGEMSRGLMNLVLMFFKVGGGEIWRGILSLNPSFLRPQIGGI